LPELWKVYNAKLHRAGGAFWLVMVRRATEERVRLLQSVEYDPQAESKVCGPWYREQIESEMDNWNAQDGMVLNKDDRWVDPLRDTIWLVLGPRLTQAGPRSI
jgi:hypothetical protein